MRVISGKAKGRRLIGPKGGAVRPTADRIKESLFNILPQDFSGMKILELFAGTGNVSIEALSRGAESVLLVDASERSARIIRENLQRLRLRFGLGLVRGVPFLPEELRGPQERPRHLLP